MSSGRRVALLLVVAMVAAACGSSTASSSTASSSTGSSTSGASIASLVRAAASKTIASSTADVVTLPRSVGFPGSPSATGTSGGSAAVGTADFTTGNGTFKLGGQASSLPWVVWAGNEYVYVPSATPGGAALPAGKTWFTFNVATDPSFLQACGPFVSWSVAFDSTLLVDLLKAVTNNAKKIGPSKVGGVPATKYRVSLDVAKLTSSEVAVPGPGGSLNSAMLGILTNLTGGSPMPALVWLDRSGRVVQESLLIDPASSGSSSAAAAASGAGITLTFSSFGATAKIVPPPVSQVIPVKSIPAGTGPYKLCAQATSSHAPPGGSAGSPPAG